MTNILVTGGAGYIGSHCCKALAQSGFVPVTLDDLSRGHRDAVRWGPLEEGAIGDAARVRDIVARHKPAAVIHFAGFTYVGESVSDPALYYRNNVQDALGFLEVVRQDALPVIFSSSAATYGIPDASPIAEDAPQRPINPYGRTKLIIEQALADLNAAYGLRWTALRYFNACGADPDGELGERHDPETHLIPRAIMAAMGVIATLELFGTDYPTPDGTCIRDYVHVTDLAQAHVLALRRLLDGAPSIALNIGAGLGQSVRQVIAAVEKTSGRKVPLSPAPRRAGDPAALVADTSRAKSMLGFEPRHSGIASIAESAWRWHNRA